MYLLQYVLLAHFGLTGAGRQPKPYVPGKPVTYPPDYCENIKNHEKFDFIVVGAGKT